MTPVDQTTFGGDEAPEPGNCVAACVASLLDLPISDVPNFLRSQMWLVELQKWLRPRGMWALQVETAPPYLPAGPADSHYIASGPGPRGRRHAVIMRDGALVHDPHPSRAGLAGEPDRFLVLARVL